MYCIHCGVENPDEGKFCAACGKGLTPTAGRSRSGDPLDSADTDLSLRPGTLLINRYRIVSDLGMGGMGRVYLADDEELHSRVAIEVMRDMLARDPGSVQRLKKEARAAMRLAHPNVVRVHDYHGSDIIKFIVMEYVEGETLAHRRVREGKLSEAETRRIGVEICQGLAHAHENDVLHRDLKPSNVLLGDNGSIKIADFGIAREGMDSMSRLSAQLVPGTLTHMSPEALMGESTPRSDIYSLGIVLYELLAGEVPFKSGDIAAQIREKMPGSIRGVSPELNGIVLKCLAKKPEDRLSSALELMEELSGRAAQCRQDAERAEAERQRTLELEARRRQAEALEAERRRREELEEQARIRQAHEWQEARQKPAPAQARSAPIGYQWKMLMIAAAAVVVWIVFVWIYQQATREPGPQPSSSPAGAGQIAQSPPATASHPASKPPVSVKESKPAASMAELIEREYREGLGMEFVRIPAGRFMMGCSPGDSECYDDEKPAHEVQITRDFELQVTEVTQAQWKAVMGNNPSHFKVDDNLPVESVSWNDAHKFLENLNAHRDGYRYRLPTEAEWEYAAHGGVAAKYYGPLNSIAWYSAISGRTTHPVKGKQPNKYGLHDMLGNLWEWCEDWYGDVYY